MTTLLSSSQLLLCSMQGTLFQDSLRYAAYGSAVFVQRFMNSHVAQAFDDELILFAATTSRLLVQEIDEEYGGLGRGRTQVSEDVMYWAGYVYRYWACLSGQSSASLYKVAPAREMFRVYEAYHTLDPAAAIRRILEAAGAEPAALERRSSVSAEEQQRMLVERGVSFLRELHGKPEYRYRLVRLDQES